MPTKTPVPPAQPGISKEEQQIRAALGNALWLEAHRHTLPSDGKTRREAFLQDKKDYVGKAARILHQLKSKNISLTLAPPTP